MTHYSRLLVTVEDVLINHTPEEWEILDDDQRRLYVSIMINLSLVVSLGHPVSRQDIVPQQQSENEPREIEREPRQQQRGPRNSEEVDIAAGIENVIRRWPDNNYSHSMENENASSEQSLPIIISDVRSLQVPRDHIMPEGQSEDELREIERALWPQQRESRITEEVNATAATENVTIGWPDPTSHIMDNEDASSDQSLPIIISDVRSLRVPRDHIMPEGQSEDELREIERALWPQQRESRINEEVNATAATENVTIGWPDPTSHSMENEDASSEQSLPIIISDVRSLRVPRDHIMTEEQSDDELREIERAFWPQQREPRVTEEVDTTTATENVTIGWPDPTSHSIKNEDASSDQSLPIIISDVRSLRVPRDHIMPKEQSEDELREIERAFWPQQKESSVTEEVDAAAATENMIMGWPDYNYSHSMENEDASSEQSLPIIISDVRSLRVPRDHIMTEEQSDDELREIERALWPQQREPSVNEEVDATAATENVTIGWPDPTSHSMENEDASSEQSLPIIISDVRSLQVPREHIMPEEQSDDELREIERALWPQQKEPSVTEEVDAAAATENMIMRWPDYNYSHSMENEDASSEQSLPIIISNVRSLRVPREHIMPEEQSEDELREIERALWPQQKESSVTEEVDTTAAIENVTIGWPDPTSHSMKNEDASSEQSLPIIISDVRSLRVPRDHIMPKEESEDWPRDLEREPLQQQRELRITEEVDTTAVTENGTNKWPDPNSYSMENKDAYAEESFSIRISGVENIQMGTSIQMDNPVLEDNLLQSWKQETSAGKQPNLDKSPDRAFGDTKNPDQVIEQQNREEFDIIENVKASSVKSCRLQIAEKFSTNKVSVDGLITSSGLDQHQATHSEKEPYRAIKCEVTLHTEQKDYMYSEDWKVSCHKEKSEQPQNTHRSQECHESCETPRESEMSVIYGSSVLPKETNKSYKCSDCSKSFVYKSHLLLHKKVHLAVKSYICDECGKSYHKKYHLTQHKRVHSGLRPFKCNECGKAYNRKDVLNVHQRTHTGIKFQCEECGKFFRHRFYVMIHKRIHLGIRPYVCDECEKSFIVKHHLNQHKKRSHTTSKPSSEINVENSSVAPPVSSYTREATMEQDPTYSTDVEELTEDEAMDLST